MGQYLKGDYGVSDKEVLNEDRIIYSLCVEDIQTVAQEKLGRELTAEEVNDVEHSLGKCGLEWSETLWCIMADLDFKKRRGFKGDE